MTQTKEILKPQDINAEAALLGAILLSPIAISEIDDFIKELDFFDKRHQLIYQSALEVYQKGQEIDILTVGSQLKINKCFKSIGGNEYLNQLINTVPTAAHIKTYAQIIVTKARRRSLIEASRSLNELANNEKKDLNQIIEEAEISLFNVSNQHVEQNLIRLEEILEITLKELEEMKDNKEDLRGLSSGFSNLDTWLAGFQKSDLIIIAGRPGMGKTGFALNLAYNMSHNPQIKKQNTVLYFSLEMSKDQLVDRILSMHTGIDNWNLRTRNLKEDDFVKIKQAQKDLSSAELYIDDSPGLNISEIRTKARRLNHQHKLDIIVVDYLQLMRGLNPSFSDNRVAEITEISRGLKLLAKELNIPIIALSQLSRQTETRENKQPNLADLRDSGAIEQDADIVAFLYREEYYNPDLEEKKGLLEFQIKKHRNGPTGVVKFYFNKEIQRYLVLDQTSTSDEN